MKDPVDAVITLLQENAAVTAVVPSTRIYRKAPPMNCTYPAISVSRVDNKRQTVGDNTGRYAMSRIQCTAWASDDETADNLSELIADCLNAVTNTYLPPGVWVISIIDAGTMSDENPEIPVYMYHRDFMVNYAYK
jgi:hypothetical protein